MSFISPHSHRRVKLLAVNCVFVALIFHSLLHLHQALVNLHQSWGPEPTVENLYQPAVWKPADSLGGSSSPPPSQSEFPCRRIPGADDVLVILKTGAMESHKKLPIHFKTTLRCIPHWRVFSDLEEDIEGYRVHDVLDEIDDGVKKSAEEFRLYDMIQQWHTRGRIPSAVDEVLYKQAWNLDKWKFLPMVKKALETRPNSKWYFFMEADTSLIWSNLLLYLSRLNPEEPHYIGELSICPLCRCPHSESGQLMIRQGAQSWIGNTELAYAGSGFIISNKALRMVVEEYTSNVPQYNELTRNEWAGDIVLAKAMKNQGIYPTRSFPILQRETPFTLDYTERHWCFPVVSYYHMTPDWIQAMWDYEQQWLAKKQAVSVPQAVENLNLD